jgi:hypothetical protein
MTFIQKARLTFLGIDDELKNDTTSVYSTPINSSFFPIPVDISSNLATEYQYQRYGVQMDPSNNFVQRTNTKRMRFSLNGALNNITLSNKAKIIIESVTIPNILSHTFKQSKCINNIQLRLRGLSKNISWDSTSKGRSTLIFTSPVFLNTQGYGDSSGTPQPDQYTAAQRPRINADNNGHLFINTSPDTLFNFNIDEAFLKNGIFEFELLYDIGNCVRNDSTANRYTYVPQTINFENDKDDFEAFQISFIVMDVEEDDKLYDNKEMLNKINKLLIEKYSMK